MQGIWVLAQELDVLDSAVNEALNGGLPFGGVERGHVTFEREQEALGTIRYHFTNLEHGDVGGLILQKRAQGCTLTAAEPSMRYTAHPFSSDEKARLRELEGEARVYAELDLIKQYDAERDEKHKQAEALHTRIMQRTLSRMEHLRTTFSQALEPPPLPMERAMDTTWQLGVEDAKRRVLDELKRASPPGVKCHTGFWGGWRGYVLDAPVFLERQQVGALKIELIPQSTNETRLEAIANGEVAENVIMAAFGAPEPASEPEPAKAGPPVKKPETFEKWRKAAGIIREYLKGKGEAYDDFDDDDVKVTNADLADALAAGMRWKPSERTITKIKRADRMGQLD